MSIVQVSPEEAAERLADGACYLDVRTVEEFVRGHPQGAFNVPLFLPAPGGRARLNGEFLAVVRAHLPQDRPILCGCASGVRSMQAARSLLESGYVDVSNVAAGFSGRHDPRGRLVEPGWQQRGLPVARGDGQDRGYAALREASQQPS